MRTIIVTVILCVLFALPRSEEIPIGYIPLEVGSSGDWTVICSGSHSIQLKMKDASDSVVTHDTLHPPESGIIFEGWVLPNLWLEGEFYLSTRDYASSKFALWLLDAKSKSFKKIITRENPINNIVAGCKGSRLLISTKARIKDDSLNPSLTTLIDVDSVRVVREWEELYIHPWGAGSSQYARYDEVTESIWIFPIWINTDDPLASETPKHMVGVNCADGDTIVVREDILFGEDIGEYLVPTVFRGHMVVETQNDGEGSLQHKGYRHIWLVDIVKKVVLGKWLLGPLEPYSGRIEEVRITDDLHGIVYLLTDETSQWDIILMHINEREPKRVIWNENKPPRLQRDENGRLSINGKILEELGLLGP